MAYQIKKFSENDVKKLSDMEYDIDGETFVKLWVKNGGEERLGQHVWDKFNGYNHSLLKLWGYLDSGNQKIMVKVINDYKERKNNTIQKQAV
jgi:hypothetical protein